MVIFFFKVNIPFPCESCMRYMSIPQSKSSTVPSNQVDPGAFRLAYDTENICNYLEVSMMPWNEIGMRWDELGQLGIGWFGLVWTIHGCFVVVKGEVKEDCVFFFLAFPLFSLKGKKRLCFLVSRQKNTTIIYFRGSHVREIWTYNLVLNVGQMYGKYSYMIVYGI